ncbi:uncharacterized protein LOC135392418 [Ornithodoros turicata]|uniref:uncharacterized protein LOC135392418 n=1 Tax=Ornithodoros turicata TaxID=34597 RepID=UPI003138B130
MIPEAVLEVDTPYYSGRLEAICLDDPLYDLVLGNVPGVRDADDPDPEWKGPDEVNPEKEDSPQVAEPPAAVGPDHDAEDAAVSIPDAEAVNAVVTRQQAARTKTLRKLAVSGGIEHVRKEDLIADQKRDQSLRACFDQIGRERQTRRKDGCTEMFLVQDGLLQRKFTNTAGVSDVQLVVPGKYRHAVLELAHEGLMAGHLGCRKTEERILIREVLRHMPENRTQRKDPKVPLQKVPVIGTPFHRVAVDIVGPLAPLTEKGNRYILTLVDYATRYPDAVALPSIETERVAEGMVTMFSRIGIPREILSDRGSNFTSDVMKEVSRLLSVNFNGTLKTMLKKMCQERPKDWDRYLEALLFAYGEVPQESLGFSPFELLYGRHVRGPLAVLKELWTEESLQPEVRTTYEYVLELRNRLEETCRLAHEELQRAGARYKKFYDKASHKRELEPGDKVLILQPTNHNKLLVQWNGPFEIVSKKAEVDYEVDLGHGTKLFHINLLKKCEERSTDMEGEGRATACMVITVGEEEEVAEPLHLLPTGRTETEQDVKIGATLTATQREDMRTALSEYAEVFSDVPGRTDLVECDLQLMAQDPVNTRQYPLPFAVRNAVHDEVRDMLRMGIIEESNSPYNSPVLVVKKADGSRRLCIDFRRLNDILVSDSEPVPRADELLASVGNKAWFSKLDFTKGYWQIPLSEDAKPKTAFSTSSGLYQFRFMPFGLKTAPAAFTKLMRKLLHGISGVEHYYDDVLIATTTWEEHICVLRHVLDRIKVAGLTVRPTKCEMGLNKVDFLGHSIGQGEITPLTKTIGKIQGTSRPSTKRQVRSFLGLVGYYRNFIPGYAALAAPLSDLTKKGKPNRVTWEEEHETVFKELKKRLSHLPVLKLPDFTKEFVLCTDASDRSIGALLLKEHDGTLHPVSCASRKLLPRESAYATVEREGLTLVWGVQNFRTFLYGRKFTIQTDHEPLFYINKQKHLNSRIMRWSLQLQEYSFRVKYIKGTENRVADYLSRM